MALKIGDWEEKFQNLLKSLGINHDNQLYRIRSGDETHIQADFNSSKDCICVKGEKLPHYVIEDPHSSFTIWIEWTTK